MRSLHVFLVLVAVVACTPRQRVENPHATVAPVTASGVDRDVTLDVAPGGAVLARDGSQVDLATIFAAQRTLVVFYRGHWCPHCRKQLGDLNAAQRQFTDRDVKIIAISSDSIDDAAATTDRLTLGFDLFVDPQLAVITKWGVEDYGSGIAKPATFIVEPGGAISFRHIATKVDDRPTVDELLAALGPAKTP